MISFDPLAERELDDAAFWYEDRRPGLGLRFVVAVDRAVKRIGTLPESFPLVPEVKIHPLVRRANVPVFPYSIVFLRLDDECRVIPVCHQKRRPVYWLERLESNEP